MKGTFKGNDAVLGIVISIIFFGLLPCFCFFAGSDAAIIIIAVVPMIIGVAPVMYVMNIPCACDADGERLTMKKGHAERTFRYEDIEQISCRFIGGDSGNGSAELTIIDRCGEKTTYRENFRADMTALINDPENTKKPLLFQLCDFVNKEMGAAA